MSEWLALVANPLSDLDGWPRLLFVALWQSTVIALLAFMAAKMIRRPAAKAGVAFLGIFAAVITPLSTTLVHEQGWGALPATAAFAETPSVEVSEPVALDTMPEPAGVQPPVDEAALAKPSVAPASRRSNGPIAATIDLLWAFWLCFVWFAVSMLFVIRLAASLRRMLRIVKRATPCVDPRISRLANNIADRMRVARPQLLISDEVRCPTVVTMKRVVILIPAKDEQLSSGDGAWNEVACSAVLRHELGHVRRRDGWSRLGIEIAVAMLPWQPLVWLLRSQFHAAAEEACDEWTVFDGTNPLDLAELLTAYVGEYSSNPIGATMVASDTKRRILKLLSTNGEIRPATRVGWRLATAVLAIGMVVAVAAAQQPAEKNPAGDEHANKQPEQAGELSRAAKTTDQSTDGAFGKDRPYKIEPPDVLTIEVGKLVPASPHKIEKLDSLQIVVENTLETAPISGIYSVNSNGEVNLGPAYGTVAVAGLSEDEATAAVNQLLKTILREPRVALTIVQMSEQYHIEGQHLVGPDGNISLGVFGPVHVDGLTLEAAKGVIERKLLTNRFQQVSIAVDVHSYNSKVFYVIEGNDAGGDRVRRMPITGNETVLDALAGVESLRIGAGTRIWVSRASKDADGNQRAVQKLEVDWDAIVKGGDSTTDYRLLPGDRVFVAPKERTRKSTDTLQRK